MTQDEYIDILFNDLQFNLATRRAHLVDYYGVESVDQLPKVKKSELIDELKEMKENKKARSSWDPEDGEREDDFRL